MNSDTSAFSHQVRLRSCGLLVESDTILLGRIHSPVNDERIWTPPGGGVTLGEPLADCLKREFAEETSLRVEVEELLHINELISPPFHAVEFFFEVSRKGGEVKKGSDPELDNSEQILEGLQWIPLSKLPDLNFAPSSLLKILLNWDDRNSFSVFQSS